MKILFITNYYPPSNYGWGYMQLCEEVADGLATKGHEIAVLTSMQCNGPEIQRSYPVHRLLTIDPDWNNNKSAAWQFFIGRRRREQQALAHFQRLVEQFNPQIIFIWHAIGLPRVLLQAVEQRSESIVVYYFAGYLPELPDEYIAYWQAQPIHPLAKTFKRPLAQLALWQLEREGKPISLNYRNVICVSDYVRRRLISQELIPQDAVVVHNGVDLSVFSPKEDHLHDFHTSGLRCLVAGRVMAEKGIHTVIEAFAALKQRGNTFLPVVLTVLGDGPADYIAFLKDKVQAHRLQDIVTFEPSIPRESMPDKLMDYNVLILPSEYAEPIARSMQEAMAMGLMVIGTITGGSGELLVHEQTGLVFEAGDAHSLAQQLARVLSDPELAIGLAQAGQERVRNAFRIDQTVSKIEVHLQSLMEQQ